MKEKSHPEGGRVLMGETGSRGQEPGSAPGPRMLEEAGRMLPQREPGLAPTLA